MPDPPKLTDAELDERINASIARIMARIEAKRLHRERNRTPTTTPDRTERIIPEPEDSDT